MTALAPEALRDRLKGAAEALSHAANAAAREAVYRESIGFVPPLADGIEARPFEVRLAALHDHIRCQTPLHFDLRLTHLLLLAMMLRDQDADALPQAISARRFGATLDDVCAVADLARQLYGISGARRSEQVLGALALWEMEDRVASAVAAFG